MRMQIKDKVRDEIIEIQESEDGAFSKGASEI